MPCGFEKFDQKIFKLFVNIGLQKWNKILYGHKPSVHDSTITA